TAGHLGLAWAWYMVSPNFASLWPSNSRPAAYGTDNLRKVVVLMTDGEFNTVYCNGVISNSSVSGSGSVADQIACSAPTGSSYDQGHNRCTQIKRGGDGILDTEDDIIVFTVGFDIADQPQAQAIMANCATDTAHAYLANSGAELEQVFREI